MPGHERGWRDPSRLEALTAMRARHEKNARDRAAARALEGSLLSLAAMLGTEVRNPVGRSVGRLGDVVVHWTTRGAYPPVRAIVLSSGRRDVLIGARWLETSPPATVRLRQSRAHPMAGKSHPADVALAADVLDRQVVDADGLRVLRPADLYLAVTQDRIELVGVEVGVRALLRRLGPRALRGRLRPERVIDWASVSAFVPARSDGNTHRGRHSDIAGAAGAGIALDRSVGEVKRLRPTDVQDMLEKLEGEGHAGPT